MYRKWLGDCFLLTFRNGGNENHIMIDCGALSGTPEGKQKIADAVDDIFQVTGGKLAALVVTHEHWDHVSGFSDAIASFKKFNSPGNGGIGEAWAAWTEDPNETIAVEKKKQNKLLFDSVKSALAAWNASSADEDQDRGAAVAALMSFMPPEGLAAFAANTNTAMHNALSLGRKRLLSPGDIVELDQIPGLCVYVLGPPKDLKELHTLVGDVGRDMYGMARESYRLAGVEAFRVAAGQPDSDCYMPFEPHLHWDEKAWSEKWGELARSYNAEPVRKIDRDWLNSAAELALQLDSFTNNTSLVLAFELTDSKEVLLFVGDAQVGNWQSWADVKFPDSKVKAADLLSRTVFYKVGHHGSHNATLKQGGLDAMTSPKLVAAIPVDEEFAHRPKGGCPKGWNMPAAPLLNALLEKTAGRVLRADSNFPKDCAKPGKLSDEDWNNFKQSTNIQDHFIEYFVR
jgi:hypothetical protein